MSDSLRQELVIANHILGNEGVLDAYGHVSVRHPQHPDRFIMSWELAPELVTADDLTEFAVDGTPLETSARTSYIERFIHGAIYEARPDVMAVCHNHALSILPFSISTETQLRPVIHAAGILGGEVPVWNMADEFGHSTDLLVRNMDHGRSLSRTLGQRRVALMRGHGSVVAGPDLLQAVYVALLMDKNAKVQQQALQLGGMIPLSQGEIDSRARAKPELMRRAWDYWKRRAGH